MKRHWPVGAEVSEAAFEGGRMLYDTQRTSNFSPEFFEPDYWRRHDAIEGTARGRGTTWFIRAGDSSFVLRHYRRGAACPIPPGPREVEMSQRCLTKLAAKVPCACGST